MIKIEITDPHLLPQSALIELATYLMKVAGAELRRRPDVLAPASPVVMAETGGQMAVPPEVVPVAPVTPFAPPVAPADVPELPLEAIESPELPPMPEAPPASIMSDELDSKGTPWDSRIHTRTRSKHADGVWKTQRGLMDTYVYDILKEINPKALKGVTPPAAVPVTPATDPMADEIDYPALMRKITKAVSNGKLTHIQVANILKDVGAPPLPVLGSRPDLVPKISAIIDNYI